MALDTLAHVGRGDPLKEYERFEFFSVNNAALQVVRPTVDFFLSFCLTLSLSLLSLLPPCSCLPGGSIGSWCLVYVRFLSKEPTMALDTLAHVGRGEPLKDYETFE